MESKSKIRKFCTNITTKVVLLILTSALASVLLMQILIMANTGINPECLIIKQYKDSYDFKYNYVNAAYDDMYQTLVEGMQMPSDANYYYYISDGKKTYTNSKDTNRAFFSQFNNAFFAFENGKWSFGKNTNPVNAFSFDDNITLYLAFDHEIMSSIQKTWEDNKKTLAPYATGILLSILFLLIFLVWLVCAAGKKPQDKDLHLAKQDKLYSDILLMILAGFIAISAGIMLVPNINYYTGSATSNYELYAFILLGICEFFAISLCLTVFLSIVRKIKAGIFLKHSLCYTVCYKIYDFFKSLYDGRKFYNYPLTKSLFYRQALFITSSFILVLLTFALMRSPLFWVPFLLEIVIIYWYIKGSRKTYEDINKGFNESILEQMKSERMKIALLTNVSHDLKTPLTSIISYIDLISKEDLSEPVRDYVKILSEKSNRLKNIVSDLFDLAKSTSGDIDVNLEKIDLKKLIQQTLADMDDEIVKSGLKFKIKLPPEPVHILADGKKIYRVFLNVIDNALKYSLKGTRVFISLEESDNHVSAAIINTAAYEMDFTADEILQRFARGDKTRTTEGSGLGLSIAESFSNLCGGNLKLFIEGDMFKVIIKFNKI